MSEIYLFLLWLSNFILMYFNDWSVVLSAGVMTFLAITAIWNITDNRRMRVEEAHRLAFFRIRDWAEQVSDALATPTKALLFAEQKGEEITKLQPGMSSLAGILYDAKILGGPLDDRVIDAGFLLREYYLRLLGAEQVERLKEDLELRKDIKPFQTFEEMRAPIKDLLTSLKDVIKSATERLVPKL